MREAPLITDDAHLWQTQALARLSQLFEQDSAARAFVLNGSLATDTVQADAWSDIDVKIVLADEAIQKYFASVAWLHPFGRLIGLERHEGNFAKTLRVCLEGFRRFDFVFVPESALQNRGAWESGLFRRPSIVLWSRLPDFEAQVVAHLVSPEYQDISEADMARMIDQFWFKATVAIGKVVRNDLLIGLHLALDLARDCLVLQMIRRDREKRSNIHRTGGWGNDLVSRFSYEGSAHTAQAILNLIQESCQLFDELTPLLLPDYKPRWSLLSPSIATARIESKPSRVADA